VFWYICEDGDGRRWGLGDRLMEVRWLGGSSEAIGYPYRAFYKWGIPKNAWIIRENPKMDDLGVPPF